MIGDWIVSLLNHVNEVLEVLRLNGACLKEILYRENEVDKDKKFIVIGKFSQLKHVELNLVFLS